MSELKYVIGDATQPQGEGTKVIVHCCNDIGGWGSGFVVALSKRWKAPEQWYRDWYRDRDKEDTIPFALGEALFVPVEVPPADQVWVANIIGQHKTKATGGQKPVRYDALDSGLEKTFLFCVEHGASLHMPRLGAGLAGGTWSVVEALILEKVKRYAVPVTVYDLPRD